jgi:tripartite-type tricarboxylate transporter receptor subunit TctC
MTFRCRTQVQRWRFYLQRATEKSASTDLLSGQVQMMFGPMPSTIEHIRAGTLRGRAVTTETRLMILPEIPTIGHSGPGYEGSGRYDIGAPKNTPAKIIEKLSREINAGLADASIKRDLPTWASIHAAGIKVESVVHSRDIP